MTTTSFPPHHLHTTTRIPPSSALSRLSSYLTATATDPSLHPNALLTENGPITPSSGTSTGLVLHNLKRVQAGLRGEVLAPELDFDNNDDAGFGDGEGGGVGVGGGADGREAGRVGGEMEIEWQDRSEFEREQEVVQGEVGGRDPAGGGEVVVVGGGRGGRGKVGGDKEARKRAKAERRRVERVEDEKRKKREKDAER